MKNEERAEKESRKMEEREPGYATLKKKVVTCSEVGKRHSYLTLMYFLVIYLWGWIVYPSTSHYFEMSASKKLGCVRHGKQSSGGHMLCRAPVPSWLATTPQGRAQQIAW